MSLIIPRQVTAAERAEFERFWTTHRECIRPFVSEMALNWFSVLTAPDNVGYNYGQLRPGSDGRKDLLNQLLNIPDFLPTMNDLIYLTRLSEVEIAVLKEQRRTDFFDDSIDPDTGVDIAGPHDLDNYLAMILIQSNAHPC